ncbi:MAG: hypothetical protein AAGH87_05490 [Pseudomonadota bacterium]
MTLRHALFLGTAAAFLPAAALADDAVSTDALYACAETADDAARLACYDAAVGRLQEAEAAGEITTVTREEVEEVQRGTFGFSLPSFSALALPRLGGDDDDDGQIDSIVSPVAKIERNAFDMAVVTLENGQVWRQTEGRMMSIRGVEEAEVLRAALGSFKMKLDGGRAFRVRRVQ